MSTATFRLYVGIDIAAESFVVALYQPDQELKPSRVSTYKQQAEDYARLHTQLQHLTSGPEEVLIAMEATSTYHLQLASWLSGLGYHVAVLNPAATAAWIKSQLSRTKTDKSDAKLLARLAAERQPPPWNPPPAIYQPFHQRLVQRAQLVELRTALKNQLHAAAKDPNALPHLLEQRQAVITYLTEQIDQLQAELKALSRQDNQWKTSLSLLQTIPGIGLITACVLVSTYRNFEASPSSAAAVQYAGLAPNERSSGTSVRGYQAIGGGGRSEVRKLLYMAAKAASRPGKAFAAYFERLTVVEKKPYKVALLAVARKLLQVAYAIVKKQVPFSPELYQANWQTRQAPKAEGLKTVA